MKDVKLSGVDIVINENGMPEMVEGFYQIVQQIDIGMTAPKGSFPYDRELGFFPRDKRNIAELSPSTVESMINECLINTDLYCKVLEIRSERFYNVVSLRLSDSFEDYEIEVRYYG
jgi:hypothetical protein